MLKQVKKLVAVKKGEKPINALAGKSAQVNTKHATRYIAGVGRRKRAVANVRIRHQKGQFFINKRPVSEFSPMRELQDIVRAPLVKLGIENEFSVEARVRGGGIRGQAEAVRLGLARALVQYKPEFRGRLRAFGFLTRDSRAKERRKYGLKKARRAPQWAKR